MVDTLNDNSFFKPTVLYKEYMILDMIEKNPNITQREISKEIGIAVSMVNEYLDQCVKDKLVRKKKYSMKTVEYFITKKGIERRKMLNIGYLSASQNLYSYAKQDIEKFLVSIEEKGFRDLILYGAGEVCEILLNTLASNPSIHLNCQAIIDDDLNKVGLKMLGIDIINRDDISNFLYDGVLISSYTNKDSIREKLLAKEIKPTKILDFFK